MEQAIYLEADEEITSVIDKLKSTEESSIKLVVPRGATILQSVVNLRLIKEEVLRLKKELILVTQDKIGRRLAAQVGLVVYEDLAKPYVAEKTFPMIPPDEVVEIDMREEKIVLPKDVKIHYYREPVEKSGRFKITRHQVETEKPPAPAPAPVPLPSQPLPATSAKNKKFPLTWLIIVIFILGVGLVATDLFLSIAKVSLRVPAEVIDKSLDLEISDKLAADELAAGKIKGELLETESEKSQTFEATGKKNMGEKAIGTIAVFNDAGVDQKVAAGSVLKATSGQTFRTTEAVDVAKATLNAAGDKVAGKTSVKIEAEESGKNSNMPESTNYKILQNDKLSAQGKTSGGSDREVKVVSEADLKAAEEKMAAELASQGVPELKEKSKKLYVVEGGIENEISQTEFSQKAGNEAANFDAKVKIKSRALAFPEESLREATLAVAQKDLPQGKTLILGDSDTILTKVSELNLNQGKMVLKITLKAHLADKIDEDNLKRTLRGKSLKEAESILEKLPGAPEIKIDRTPSFGFQRMPFVEKNIKFKLEYQR